MVRLDFFDLSSIVVSEGCNSKASI